MVDFGRFCLGMTDAYTKELGKTMRQKGETIDQDENLIIQCCSAGLGPLRRDFYVSLVKHCIRIQWTLGEHPVHPLDAPKRSCNTNSTSTPYLRPR